MPNYRLLSTPAICAPGIVAWAINGYAFESDRPQLLAIIRDGWNVPEAAAHALLSKAVAYTIDPGETVAFSFHPMNPATSQFVEIAVGEYECEVSPRCEAVPVFRNGRSTIQLRRDGHTWRLLDSHGKEFAANFPNARAALTFLERARVRRARRAAALETARNAAQAALWSLYRYGAAS
jgi:hypothetical protein